MRGVFFAAVVCVAGLAAASAGAKDIIVGKGGSVVGTNKADRITAVGGGVHRIRCKAGRDIVTANAGDTVAADCEVVSLRVSHDPYKNSISQHQTQVEPDSIGYGTTEVTVFQTGRIGDGGAANIGWASTSDSGETWSSGFLPGITMFGAPPGPFPRVSDPSVGYDRKHGVWMIAALAFGSDANGMLISRSTDGASWEMPVTALLDHGDLDYDKEWIACDNWPSSPYYGNCYLSYADFGKNRLLTQTSSDGGLTWGPQVPSPPFGDDSLNGSQPVVQPDGKLVNLFSGRTTLGESISTDGGSTFTPASTIHEQAFIDVPRMRNSPFPTVEVDAAGTIYAVWNDCALRRVCNGLDLVWTASNDGVTWTAPQRIPTGAQQSGHSYFLPAIAADPVTAGHLGVVYYEMPPCGCSITASYVGSTDGGGTWTKPQRLTSQALKPGWLARTTLGLMLGDYISVSFLNGKPLPVFALASKPVGRARSLREAMFVTVRGIS